MNEVEIMALFVLFVSAALMVYLLLNNSTRFSRMLVKLRFRKDVIPENKAIAPTESEKKQNEEANKGDSCESSSI
jgi:hypothetical protein